MTNSDCENKERVVYDCNVLLQALLNWNGPAGACLRLVLNRDVDLQIIEYILAELRQMPFRATPHALGLTEARVDRAITEILAVATVIADVPEHFTHPIDSKDSHYVNLAIAMGSKLIVSRDKHLLNLINPAKPWSLEFRQRFPTILVLKPEELLAFLESRKR